MICLKIICLIIIGICMAYTLYKIAEYLVFEFYIIGLIASLIIIFGIEILFIILLVGLGMI